MFRMKALLLIVPLLLPACAAKKTGPRSSSASTEAQRSLGGRTFAGILPGSLDCKSVRTEITLFEAGRRFAMKETCLGNPAGELVEESRGEWALVKSRRADATT